MVDVTNGVDIKNDEVNMLYYNEQVQVVYPRAKDEMIYFLKKCELKDSKTMLSPLCNSVFKKKASKEVERTKSHANKPRRSGIQDKQWRFILDNKGVPHIVQQS